MLALFALTSVASPLRSDASERCPIPPLVEPATVTPTVNRSPGAPVRFSPNSNLMMLGTHAPRDPEKAVGQVYGPVTIWQTETGRLIQVLGEETHGYLHGTFTPDSRYAVVQTHTDLSVWRIADGAMMSHYPVQDEQLWSTSDGVLVTSSRDGTRSRLFPLLQEGEVEPVEVDGRFVPLSPEGGATLHSRFEARIIDFPSYEVRVRLPLVPENPAAKRLAELELAEEPQEGAELPPRLWDSSGSGEPLTLEATSGGLRAVGDALSRVHLVNDRTGAEIGEVWVGASFKADPGEPDVSGLPEPEEGASWTAVVEAPFGSDFVVARDSLGFETAWKAVGDGEFVEQYRRRAGVRRLAFSEDGTVLYALDHDGTLASIDTTTGRVTERRFWGAGRLRRLIVLDDDQGYAALSEGGDVFVWDREGQLRLHLGDAGQVRLGSDPRRNQVAIHPASRRLRGFREDAGTLVAVWADATPMVWRSSDGVVVSEPDLTDPIEPGLRRISASADGRYHLYQHPETNAVYMRDNVVGRRVPAILRRGEVEARFDDGGAIRFDLDDQRYVWGPTAREPVLVEEEARGLPEHRSADGSVAVWTEEPGQLTVRTAEGERSVDVDHRRVVLSADGMVLAIGTGDGGVLRWALAEEAPVPLRKRDKAPVEVLAFAADGTLVSGSTDGMIRVWGTDGRPMAKLGIDAPPEQLAVAPEGRAVLASSASGVHRWTKATGSRLWSDTAGVAWLGFTPSGAEAVVLWNEGGEARLPTDAPALSPTTQGAMLVEVRHDATAQHLATVDVDGKLVIRDLADAPRDRWERRPVDVRQVDLSADGCSYVATSGNGVVELRDVARDRLWARFALGTNRKGPPDWVVMDDSGRYDASRGGFVPWFHYVAELPTGMETIGLDELRSFYYQPGFYPSLFASDLQAPPQFDPSRSMYPETRWALEEREGQAPLVHITLRRRGGGYGRVAVVLDGREIIANAVPPGADLDRDQLELTVDLADVSGYAPRADRPNLLGVVAYSESERLASRGQARRVTAPASTTTSDPHLWVVGVGTERYQDPRLDLKYAVEDAQAFVEALELGARPLFDDRIHTVVLENPNRSELVDAFEGVQVQPDDVVVVFFAGHGVVEGGQWMYPTRDANTDDWKRAGLREARTFSSEDLTGYLSSLPNQRRVVVLDTCGAGAVSADVLDRSAEDLRQRKLMSQLEQRTGTFVLAGSAADAASKEDVVRGHGLLTWSLLAAMERRAEWQVDALFSDALETLDTISDGQQTGYKTASRAARSFPLGQATDEVRAAVDLRGPEAVLVRSQLHQQDDGVDTLNLQEAVDLAVEHESDALDFVDAYTADQGYRIAGSYRVDGSVLRADINIWDLERAASIGRFVVEGLATAPSEVAGCVARSAQRWIRYRIQRGVQEPPSVIEVDACR